jgi:ABC-type amino acid transport substrate-binding protein
MLDKLNAALKVVWDNGTYKKLEEKYGLVGKLREPSDL